MGGKRSTTLIEIREHIREALIKDLEKTPADANAIAYCIAGVIRAKWGGSEGIYIPKEDSLDERDWQMWEMFNGLNYDEVGKAFDLTGRQVRNRMRIIKPIAEARNQQTLFDHYLEASND